MTKGSVVSRVRCNSLLVCERGWSTLYNVSPPAPEEPGRQWLFSLHRRAATNHKIILYEQCQAEVLQRQEFENHLGNHPLGLSLGAHRYMASYHRHTTTTTTALGLQVHKYGSLLGSKWWRYYASALLYLALTHVRWKTKLRPSVRVSSMDVCPNIVDMLGCSSPNNHAMNGVRNASSTEARTRKRYRNWRPHETNWRMSTEWWPVRARVNWTKSNEDAMTRGC